MTDPGQDMSNLAIQIAVDDMNRKAMQCAGCCHEGVSGWFVVAVFFGTLAFVVAGAWLMGFVLDRLAARAIARSLL